jgi:peptidoglycan/xylan/chitin deacetylase (PgdA/CDA1 family)
MLSEQPAMRRTTMLGGFPNKRQHLARALGGAGILRLLEGIARRWRPYLAVLTYHRIAEQGADLFYEPVISATPESFRAQVKWLRSHLHLVTLEELIAQIETGSPWREPTVFLTFDDAYRDNFEIAVPILLECEAPATFFIPTGFLESPRLPWWDTVAYVIKKTQVRRLMLDRDGNGRTPPLAIDLDAMTRTVAITTIIRAFLDDTVGDEPWFLDQLAAQSKVTVNHEELGRALFMNWEQVQKLAGSGMGLTIGSHGNGHRKLAALDEHAQRHELAESKQILEAHLNREVMALAYPYGWSSTFTAQTKTLAALAGYRVAFASQEHVNRPRSIDPHEISRLGVGSGDSPALLRARIALHAAFGRSFL